MGARIPLWTCTHSPKKMAVWTAVVDANVIEKDAIWSRGAGGMVPGPGCRRSSAGDRLVRKEACPVGGYLAHV